MVHHHRLLYHRSHKNRTIDVLTQYLYNVSRHHDQTLRSLTLVHMLRVCNLHCSTKRKSLTNNRFH